LGRALRAATVLAMQFLEGGATGPNGRESHTGRSSEQDPADEAADAPGGRGSLMSRYRGAGPAPGADDQATPPQPRTGDSPIADSPWRDSGWASAPPVPVTPPVSAAPPAPPLPPVPPAPPAPPVRDEPVAVRPAPTPPPPSSSAPPARPAAPPAPLTPPAASAPAVTPASDTPATDKQATDKPPTDKPPTDRPATDRPATDKPAGAPADKPAIKAADEPAATPADTAADRPASTPAVTVTRGTAPGAVPSAGLLSADQTGEFKQRWRDLQGDFVDDPQQAVRGAGDLAREVLQTLSDAIADSDRVESWQAGDGSSSTEDLRVALRQYRTLVDRLLEL
jgi:hypothetical protein